MLALINKLNETIEKRESVALCTIVSTSGSTPLKAGAKMIVWTNGTCFGTIGGGNIEKSVIFKAINVINSGDSILEEYHLVKEEMCCGGKMKIFIESIKKTKQLLIFGAGHIGKEIAKLAQGLNFVTILIDERQEMLKNVDLSFTKKYFCHHSSAFSKLEFDHDTYIVICTHLHEYDREILAYCVNQPKAYLGMIGSKRKVLITIKRFLEQNICSRTTLDSIDMPIGFDIGQNSPAEIALGIVAKIIAISNKKLIVSQLNLVDYEEKNFNSNGCC